MSYIRCTSNPEGLYVWCCNKYCNIWHGDWEDSNKIKIPIKIWNEYEKSFRKNLDHIYVSNYNKNRFIIKEVQYCKKLGRNLIKKDIRDFLGIYKHPTKFLWQISYKGKLVRVNEVTWHYIMYNVARGYHMEQKNKNARRNK